jgi:DNA-binding SARP family transcriptional activator
VLAVLAVRANTAVSIAQLMEAAWQQPPPSARSNVRTYIAGLRELLREPAGGSSRLMTTPQGYRLEVRPDELDVVAFDTIAQRAVAAAGQGDHAAVVDLSGRCLSIWRGAPLARLPLGPLLQTEVARLEDLRLQLVELRADARLRSGDACGAVGELRGLVAEHPFRERFTEQLMLALLLAGDPVGALEVYRQTRNRLVAELGIEPGEELQRLQHRVLRGSTSPHRGEQRPERRDRAALHRPPDPRPAGRTVPAELPAAVRPFVGRDRVLACLDGLARGSRTDAAMGVVVGMAGVGKSAVVTHWAHNVTDRFPDGQLFLEMSAGGVGQPRTAGGALASMLRAVGTPPTGIVHADAATWRTAVAGKRLLVVLDDVSSADQVRPLLPGTPGSLVLVTSRQRLAGLVALQGARPIPLEPLDLAASVELLQRLLADRRSVGKPAELAELAAACGGLPLALRIAAARITAAPWLPPAVLLARLRRADGLSALEVPGDSIAGVRAAFDRPTGSCRNRLGGCSGCCTSPRTTRSARPPPRRCWVSRTARSSPCWTCCARSPCWTSPPPASFACPCCCVAMRRSGSRPRSALRSAPRRSCGRAR